jgi:hypothetical protein
LRAPPVGSHHPAGRKRRGRGTVPGVRAPVDE